MAGERASERTSEQGATPKEATQSESERDRFSGWPSGNRVSLLLQPDGRRFLMGPVATVGGCRASLTFERE